MILCMPERVSGGDAKFQGFCDRWNKWEGQRVSSLSLVRYRGTDYSVPTRFGHCEVLVRGYVHEVVISCAAEVIARHPRSYEQEDFVFDPLHYLDRVPRSGVRALRSTRLPAGRAGTFRLPRWAA